ncbi:transposase [Bradyrhizobium japonicum]|nr:hypothetical protein BEL01nite_57710 [Bradyrhizobium elkanii]
MRGGDNRMGELFSYVDLEARVRRDHPLRAIRTIVNEALSTLEREFAALYSPIGRPSIPPEKLLRAMLLQAFYSIRSERLLMERLEYDLLFRWFVGILEASNRSRVADLAASPARDLFEAGLNEAASCERGPMGARSRRR